MPHEVPGDFPDEQDDPDLEFLEFLGSLDEGDAEWQEFFEGMSNQIDAEEDADAN